MVVTSGYLEGFQYSCYKMRLIRHKYPPVAPALRMVNCEFYARSGFVEIMLVLIWARQKVEVITKLRHSRAVTELKVLIRYPSTVISRV